MSGIHLLNNVLTCLGEKERAIEPLFLLPFIMCSYLDGNYGFVTLLVWQCPVRCPSSLAIKITLSVFSC